MNRTFQTKDRGLQILKLLKLHGPLSFRGLKHMVEPEIKDRRLNGSIAILVKNGFIRKRQERVFRGAGVFYQIAQELKTREKVASILSCPPNELLQPFFRSRELIHTEACALLVHSLRKLFPDAILVRDFEFYHNTFVHEILLTERNDYDLLPDVLMMFQGDAGLPQVSVAFEVERSRKAEKRVGAKLHKYANETALDGVVYICESKEISEPVRKVFKMNSSQKSLRIKHYGEYFFLFSNDPNELFLGKTKMFNANVSPISLEAWVTHLRSAPLVERRNKNFEVVAVSCYHFENRA